MTPPNPDPSLSDRRSATLAALLAAGLDELREKGYEQLTVRSVASRAGVTHTTAYSYFGSKSHLVAEIYWRQLQDLSPATTDERASVAERIHRALDGPALILGDEPELAQAALAALLTSDTQVSLLRDAIGANLSRRMTVALGPDAPPELTDALLLAFSGAMLQAGMGYFDFDGVVARMDSLARMVGDR